MTRKKTAASPAYRAAMRDLALGAAAAAVIGIFVNILYLAMPIYHAQIYDRVISSGNYDTLIALSLIVVILLTFQAMLDFLRSRLFMILAGRIESRLGRSVFEAAVESALNHGPSSAATALRDLGSLRGFVAGGSIALPLDLAFTPILIVVLTMLHPFYGMVGLAGAVLLSVAAVATEFLARRPVADATRASSAVQAESSAAIRNAEVIAAMGMLPAVARRWRISHARSLERIESGRSAAKALVALARGLRLGLQIAVICTGAVVVIGQEASAGTIMAAMVITSRMLSPFEHLIDGWRQWMTAFSTLRRLREVLESGGSARSANPVEINRAELVVDRLSYVPAGQDVPLLRNITFRIGPGEMVGVIGPSGAGKSTLARLVVGLWAPTTGGIFLDGQSTYRHERASFGEAVGYLPQEPLLLDGSVRENICRFRETPMAAVVAAARQAGVHELIGRLPKGYETLLADAGARLSGGQRQRIALARAIFGVPKLLVLDEPNSSLDAEGEAALVEAIEAARKNGAAVLVIAQRMSILNKADRLLVLKDGVVANYGPKSEILATMGPQGARRPRGVREAAAQ
ncbi:type I secretion system permease/ATPase [Paenirhodobacter sp.]|uniref:type I secretion system permease/ATPase n=1 Tax=Paenirhodobacter sp. TaxID=1965326 RepID=UPI003B3ED275